MKSSIIVSVFLTFLEQECNTMAPKSAARNASPAPRASKKTKDTKESEQPPKKPQTTPKEPQKPSEPVARGKLASACGSIRNLGCSISLRSKMAMVVFLMLVIACAIFQPTYTGGVNELTTKLQSVYVQVKSLTDRGLASLASKPKQASADL